MINALVRIATAPVYVPVCGGLWLFYYITDMQGAIDRLFVLLDSDTSKDA